jgi:hypothetical protein
MDRRAMTLARIALVAAASVAVTALAFAADAAPGAVVAAVAMMLVTGALVDRYWAALVPPAGAVLYGIFMAANPPENEHHENGWMLGVLMLLLVALVASLCLSLGTAVRRFAQSRRSDFSPQNDAT